MFFEVHAPGCAATTVSSQLVLWKHTWGRPGFDSGYVVRASMQSGDERLLKTIITP